MTIKCFQCIIDEYNQKIKLSQLEEAVCIISGQSYCFKHLQKEIGWDKEKKSGEKLK